jgi:hypothetical protein
MFWSIVNKEKMLNAFTGETLHCKKINSNFRIISIFKAKLKIYPKKFQNFYKNMILKKQLKTDIISRL